MKLELINATLISIVAGVVGIGIYAAPHIDQTEHTAMMGIAGAAVIGAIGITRLHPDEPV